jgi:hypothetical protein
VHAIEGEEDLVDVALRFRERGHVPESFDVSCACIVSGDDTRQVAIKAAQQGPQVLVAAIDVCAGANLSATW